MQGNFYVHRRRHGVGVHVSHVEFRRKKLNAFSKIIAEPRERKNDRLTLKTTNTALDRMAFL